MLNTSFHNPDVWNKPGLELFGAMNQGINEGGTCLKSCSGIASAVRPSVFLRMMGMV